MGKCSTLKISFSLEGPRLKKKKKKIIFENMGLKGLGRIRPVVITYMIQVTMETMITSIDYEAATVPDTLHSLFPSLPAAHWSGRYYCYFYICRLVTRDFKNFNNLPNTMHVKISMSKLAYKNIPCQWIRK